MKKKEMNQEFDKISDQVEFFLNSLSEKDRRYFGINFCMFIAGISAKKMTAKSSAFDVFDPLKVLDEAQKELQALIASEVDAFIDEEVGNAIKKN